MPILELDHVSRTFALRGGETIYAVDDISLGVERGETLALIGESGSGKSTVGRIALRLLEATGGTVRFDGQDLGRLSAGELRALRARLQVVFQEPFESLNPRLTVGSTVEEPLHLHHRGLSSAERRRRVGEALEHVGLSATFADRFPGELSGGQQQRVGIARAIVTNPDFVVLDEPTSSLDLSVRAQILQLLARLQQELGMAYLFISHDIHTVSYVANRVAVMYLGRLVEVGDSETVLRTPAHPYTKALLSSTLSIDPDMPTRPIPLRGEPSPPTSRVTGCVLHPRCPAAQDRCIEQEVRLIPHGQDHEVACLRAGEPELDDVLRTVRDV